MLIDGPDNAFATILLAHGRGADGFGGDECDHWALVGVGFRVARFEFAYMAARRQGARKPPPRAELLRGEYLEAIDRLAATGPLYIGGKSMRRRVASLVADGLFADGRIAGLLCLGYSFHPPVKPDQLRTAHLAELKMPTLICQGTRDPFGTRDDVAPTDLDIYPTKSWDDDALIQPESRAAFRNLVGQSWTDALRHMNPDARVYTFWHYKRLRWQRDAGLRLDHLLLSANLRDKLMDAGVDRDVRGEDGASDPAPVWIRLGG